MTYTTTYNPEREAYFSLLRADFEEAYDATALRSLFDYQRKANLQRGDLSGYEILLAEKAVRRICEHGHPQDVIDDVVALAQTRMAAQDTYTLPHLDKVLSRVMLERRA